MTVILFVLCVAVLIVTLTIVARNARNGREEELLLYVKHRCSLKSKRSKPKTQASPPPPPVAPPVPSSHPALRSDFESQLDLIGSQVSALSDLFQSRLVAPQAIGDFLPASHAPSQAWLESDAPLPPSCRDCWSPPGVTGSGRLGQGA